MNAQEEIKYRDEIQVTDVTLFDASLNDADSSPIEVIEPPHDTQLISEPIIEQTDFDFNKYRDITKLILSLIISDTYAFRNISFPSIAERVNNDAEHTAAIALIIPMANVMVMGVSLLFSMNVAGSTLVGELKRLDKNSEQWQLKRHKLIILYRNGLIISTVVAPVCMVIMIFSGPILHNIFQQNKTVSYLAQDFLRPYASTVPAVFFWMCAAQITSSFKYKKASVIGPITFGIGLILAIGLGLGKMNMPKKGNAGILSGFILEAYLTAALTTAVIAYASDFKELGFMNFFENVGNTWEDLWLLLDNSAAITTTVASEICLLFYLGVLSGWLGSKFQAAYALTVQYMVVNGLLAVNCAVASAMTLGNTIGSEQHQHVYRAKRDGLYTSLILCTPIPIISEVYPQLLMKLFNIQDPEVAQLLQRLAWFISAGLMLDAASYTAIIQARVFGDKWNSTIERVASIAVGAILATCLVKFTDLGIESIGWGFFVAMLLSAVTLNRRCNIKMQEYRNNHNIKPSDSTILSRIGLLPSPNQPYTATSQQEEKTQDLEMNAVESFTPQHLLTT